MSTSIASADDPGMWERFIRWWEGPDHNPRSMDEDLLEWVLTCHPEWIKMGVDQEALNRRIKEMEARGEPILPDSFSALRLTRMLAEVAAQTDGDACWQADYVHP